MLRISLIISMYVFSHGLLAQPCSNYVDITADCGLSCSGNAAAYPTGQVPFVYSWQPGGQTTQQISNLCPGSYTVTVTDSLGCVTIDTVVINGSPIMNVWISSFTNPSCFGCTDGTASGSVNGGTAPYYPYWNPPIGFGMYTINGLCAGTYVFCVIDTFGCESCADTVLEDPLSIVEHAYEFEVVNYELYDFEGKLISTSVSRQQIAEGTRSGTYILAKRNQRGEMISRELLFIDRN